jgi:hypothetical protein
MVSRPWKDYGKEKRRNVEKQTFVALRSVRYKSVYSEYPLLTIKPKSGDGVPHPIPDIHYAPTIR